MLTLKEAINNFRKQWEWIADKTLTRKVKVIKANYFSAHGISAHDLPLHGCYLCEYIKAKYIGDICQDCPH